MMSVITWSTKHPPVYVGVTELPVGFLCLTICGILHSYHSDNLLHVQTYKCPDMNWNDATCLAYDINFPCMET